MVTEYITQTATTAFWRAQLSCFSQALSVVLCRLLPGGKNDSMEYRITPSAGTCALCVGGWIQKYIYQRSDHYLHIIKPMMSTHERPQLCAQRIITLVLGKIT